MPGKTYTANVVELTDATTSSGFVEKIRVEIEGGQTRTIQNYNASRGGMDEEAAYAELKRRMDAGVLGTVEVNTMPSKLGESRTDIVGVPKMDIEG
jgi:hypothetical protein